MNANKKHQSKLVLQFLVLFVRIHIRIITEKPRPYVRIRNSKLISKNSIPTSSLSKFEKKSTQDHYWPLSQKIYGSALLDRRH